MRRHKLIGWVALTLALVGCTEVRHCKPCSGRVVNIDVSTLRADGTAVRVCLDGECRPIQPMPKAPSVFIGSEAYDTSEVILEVYRGKRQLESYTGPLDVRRPTSKNCGCPRVVDLITGHGGTHVQMN